MASLTVTLLNISDRFKRDVKVAAAERGVSAGKLVLLALEQYLKEEKGK